MTELGNRMAEARRLTERLELVLGVEAGGPAMQLIDRIEELRVLAPCLPTDRMGRWNRRASQALGCAIEYFENLRSELERFLVVKNTNYNDDMINNTDGEVLRVSDGEWHCSKPVYSIRWREEPETGMLHFHIHLISPGGDNRGVVLEVSPNVLYPVGEGLQFPHTRITEHLLKSQHATFDENAKLKKQLEELKSQLGELNVRIEKRNRKLRAARQTLRSWGHNERHAALMEFLYEPEEPK